MAAILGTGVALVAGRFVGAVVTISLVPVAAGGFVYIAAADLIPELQHDRSRSALWVQTLSMTAGFAVMALLTRLE